MSDRDHRDHARDDDPAADRTGDAIDLRLEHPTSELSALLDGELSPVDEAAVRRHVDGCEPCRTELDEVAAVRRAVRDLPAVAAPPGFVTQLVDRRRRADRRGVVVTLVAAALALVVAVVTTADDGGAPVGAGGDSQQVALVDRQVRQFPPTPSESASGAGLPRWDAGRPGPDERLSSPARSNPPGGDDEESMLDRAHQAGREMLDLMGG